MSSNDEVYETPAITVTIYEGRCIHSRNCVLGRPDVWVPNAPGRWVHPEKAQADVVAAVAVSCVSGAIGFKRNDGGTNETAPEVNTIRVRENGPLALHAQLNINGDTQHFRATLCRCGASKNKPYCDTSHHDIGFQATGEPETKDSTALAQRNGPLQVDPQPNGPLKVTGSAEVVSGTGRTINRAESLYLCRCGHSSNKPYCDGTHKRIGFQAP